MWSVKKLKSIGTYLALLHGEIRTKRHGSDVVMSIHLKSSAFWVWGEVIRHLLRRLGTYINGRIWLPLRHYDVESKTRVWFRKHKYFRKNFLIQSRRCLLTVTYSSPLSLQMTFECHFLRFKFINKELFSIYCKDSLKLSKLVITS